jgi:hypothetical protein
MELQICAECVAVRDAPIRMAPIHIVHPERRTPRVFDVRCEAVCPTCGTRWRRGIDNAYAILQAR